MFKSIIALALLATATTVSAGGMQVCTGKNNCIEKQITKDCCAAVGDQKAWFDESNHQCTPYTSGGINTGGMVDCCESRGAGSQENHELTLKTC